MFSFLKKFRYFDVPLQIATILLVVAGLALLYSTSLSGDGNAIFWRQVIFLGLGLLAYIFFSFFDYHSLAKTNKLFYVIIILALFYLLVFGGIIRGGRRWIDFGFFRFQPAELVRLSIILGLARLLYLRRGQINSLSVLSWSFVYTLIPTVLILLEPDFGSALVILGLWTGIIMLSPIKKKFLAILFLCLIPISGVTWKFFLKDFQKDRVMVFLNPSLDPKGRGYNVRQAAIAVGSGQFFGKGLGKGLQGQNRFLPERQTDFIFAASAEEIGFLGTFSLIALYFFCLFRLLKIAHKARDDLGMYIAGGILFLFFFHLLINIGMNLGLLPVTGIPLPFLSAGGSSLIVALASLGIAQNICQQSKALRF